MINLFTFAKFVEFSFIGVFFLYPNEFYFDIKDESEKIQFAKHWGKIMKKFGIKNNENFLKGDLEKINVDLKAQKDILFSKMDSDKKGKSLYLKTLKVSLVVGGVRREKKEKFLIMF